MATPSRSSRLFRERKGRRATVREPQPVLDGGSNRQHHRTLQPPLPLPELLGPAPEDRPPDQGLSQPWPHGEVEGN